MIRTSATEERTSQMLGRKPHRCWRPRMTYVVAWLPNTMPTTDRVRSASIFRCNSNLPTARIAVEKARKQVPRITPAIVIPPICQEFGVFEGDVVDLKTAVVVDGRRQLLEV